MASLQEHNYDFQIDGLDKLAFLFIKAKSNIIYIWLESRLSLNSFLRIFWSLYLSLLASWISFSFSHYWHSLILARNSSLNYLKQPCLTECSNGIDMQKDISQIKLFLFLYSLWCCIASYLVLYLAKHQNYDDF